MTLADTYVLFRWGHGWLAMTGWGFFMFALLLIALMDHK